MLFSPTAAIEKKRNLQKMLKKINFAAAAAAAEAFCASLDLPTDAQFNTHRVL